VSHAWSHTVTHHMLLHCRWAICSMHFDKSGRHSLSCRPVTGIFYLLSRRFISGATGVTGDVRGVYSYSTSENSHSMLPIHGQV